MCFCVNHSLNGSSDSVNGDLQFVKSRARVKCEVRGARCEVVKCEVPVRGRL